MTTTELLAMLQRIAPDLRAAGVTSLEVTGLKATLAPYQPPALADDDEEEAEHDVLDDPATYGNQRTVPGRRRDKAAM